MSNDFLSAEELAELEAELADLDDSDEPDTKEGTSEKALEEAPKERLKKAEPPETEAVETPAESDDGPSDADLEAELEEDAFDADADAIEAELNPAEPESKPDHEREAIKAKQVEQEAEKRAIYEAEKRKQAEVESKLSQEKQPVEDAGPTNSEDELTDMLLNSGSVFNPKQLQKDLAFNEHNLDDAFMSQSGMFAHYSGVAHRAARRHDQLSQQVKLVEAKLDQEIRQEASSSGEKLTEAAIKNRILLDPRHRKITERMLDAKAVAGMTKDACESFKQRRDMLIQIGANVREEHKGEMRMKAARESQDDMKDRALARMNQG